MTWRHPAAAATSHTPHPPHPSVHSHAFASPSSHYYHNHNHNHTTARTNVKYEDDDEDVPLMQLTATPVRPPNLTSLFDALGTPPPFLSPANGYIASSLPSLTPPVIRQPVQRAATAVPALNSTTSPAACSPAAQPTVHGTAPQSTRPQRPNVKLEAQQQQQQHHQTHTAEWNKENHQQPPHHALNGYNSATQQPHYCNKQPMQPATAPHQQSPPPPLSPAPQQPFGAAVPGLPQNPYSYLYPRSSAPPAPVVPFIPPPTADVPHATNLSFHSVKPGAHARPTPVLSKAAKRRLAAKETPNEDSTPTPTKRKRTNQPQPQPQLQHDLPPASPSRQKRSGRKKEEDQPDAKQASLYSFFASPQQQTSAGREREERDEDEGEAEFDKSQEKAQSKRAMDSKRRKKSSGDTLEEVEADARRLLFDTEDAAPPQAASKAGKKKASKVKDVGENEMAEDDNFVEPPSKQCALGLYASQADYSRNLLATLRQQYQDISQPPHTVHLQSVEFEIDSLLTVYAVSSALCAATSRDALEKFWSFAYERLAVSIAAVYYNGSTSYRWPSDDQKKRFRLFNRLGGRRRDAKTIDTVDVREHGVLKCTALTFKFAVRDSEAASGVDESGLRFMMTVWRDKSEAEMSEEERMQLAAVIEGVMAFPIDKVMFEAKDVLTVLMSALKWVQAPQCQKLIDVQVACWLLDPNVSKESERSKYQLLPLLHQHLEQGSGYDTDVTDKPGDIARGLFADLTDVLSLWANVQPQLMVQRMQPVFQDQEMRLLPVLAEMQYLGTRFDGEHFKHAQNAIITKMTTINEQLVTIAGTPFLVTSPQAVAVIMYDKMHFQRISSGEHGRTQGKNTHPPTNENVIQSLLSIERDETRRAFLIGISQYRKLNKTKTTYMNPLLEAAEEVRTHPMDPHSHDVIFCSWNQTHASTGRLSTSLPNLQSLPRGTKTVEEEEEFDEDDDEEAAAEDADADGRRASKIVLREINIRDCFRPQSNDSLFLSADFNQMEMRIMAHLSNDHHLVHFFNAMQGSDIYIFMASLCFDCDESDVTKEQRACAKQLSLGILYGMGADNMAKKLTRFTGRTYTMNEASRLISKWKDKFSGVARFMQKAKDDALKNHCARTLWGRVRPLPEINHANSRARSYAERQAVNSVIQGTAADMAKRAMIAIHDELRQLHTDQHQPFPALARLTLQLHDEIILEVQSGFEAHVAELVRRCMEKVFVPPAGEAEARVPFPVSLKVGRTLGTLQPFELPREEPAREEPEPALQEESKATKATASAAAVAVAVDVGSVVVPDDEREWMEFAAANEDEWSDYSAATPASQQLRSSLASTVTTSPSQSSYAYSRSCSTPTTAAHSPY